jgi:ribosomal protein S6
MKEKDITPEASGENRQETGLVYELGYHLLPNLSDEEVLKEVTDFKGLIEKNGGSLVAEEAPKPMHLAYTMVKKQEGKNARFDNSFFGWVKFEISAEGQLSVNEEVDQNKNVLRFIIIKTLREYVPLQHKELFKEPEQEAPKPISKPVMEKKSTGDKPISDAELDKSIEDLVSK